MALGVAEAGIEDRGRWPLPGGPPWSHRGV